MKDNRRIIIFDTTLRDGEQSPGASMNKEEKLRIARQLESLGVDVIEAGFPAASDGDYEAVKAVAGVIKNAQVAALCRTEKADIERAWDAIKGAKNPRIHTFIATSELHMAVKLKLEPEKVLKKAVEAVKYAKTFTDNVEFSAEDGSRSDRDFLCTVFEAVIDAGATTINLPDTVGYTIPEEFGELIRYVIKNISNIDQAVFSVHCHNDLGLATSNTLAAIQNGVRQVEVTINGIGERAGNASLEEVIMIMKTKSSFFPYITGINTTLIFPTSRLVSRITGILVQPNRAIVGANAFAHEAGIHQAGMLKNPLTYEIMKPESIGLKKNNIVLGKHSGRHALRDRLSELSYNLPDEKFEIVFTEFKRLADKKKDITDDDLEAIIAEKIFRSDDVFCLEYIHVLTGNTVFPTASIQLRVNGKSVQGAKEGIGPIDAVINAISELTGNGTKLLRFTISAISEGTDSQGEVTVRLEQNNVVALGQGTDPDIITASALAYINGLNRLEALKKNPYKLGTGGVNLGKELKKS